ACLHELVGANATGPAPSHAVVVDVNDRSEALPPVEVERPQLLASDEGIVDGLQIAPELRDGAAALTLELGVRIGKDALEVHQDTARERGAVRPPREDDPVLAAVG